MQPSASAPGSTVSINGHEPRAPGAPRPPELIGLRFGEFTLDLRTAELRRAGVLVKLQNQPARVLGLLASRAGQLVLREEICREVWGEGTFVDYDQGLNFCVRQVRAALGDDAAEPRYIETLPRRGYRFLGRVERLCAEPVPRAAAASVAPPNPETPRAPRRGSAWRAALAALALTTLGAWGAWHTGAPGEASAPGADKAALVVLPFENMSGDPEQEYMSDGLTEELITRLAGLAPARLLVIARTSAMSYKGRRVDLRELRRELRVDYVLEGSLRRAEGRLRVTAQLIRAADQTHLWAASWDEREGDVIAIQNDVAARIARALAPHVLPASPAAPAAVASQHPEAYDAYLRGRHLWGRRNPEALGKALALLQRATELDPGFAAAYAALARAHLDRPLLRLSPSLQAYPPAKAAAQRALELDPTLAEAHMVMGIVRGYYEWDLPGGFESFQRALELNPALADAHHAVCDYYSALGRHDEALASLRRAIELDPVSPLVGQDIGWYSFFARRYDEAGAAFERMLESDPGEVDNRLGLALARWHAGRKAEGLRLQLQTIRDDLRARGDTRTLPDARVEELLRMEPEAAQRELLLALRAHKLPYWGPFMLPAMLGEREATLDGLEAAAERHGRFIQVFAAGDPRLDFVRGEPRFRALLRRIGLPVPGAKESES